MMKPISNYFAVRSKKVYILHEELENEMYREEMGKKKEKDALDAEEKLVVEQAVHKLFPEAALISMRISLNLPLLHNGSNDFLLNLKTSFY